MRRQRNHLAIVCVGLVAIAAFGLFCAAPGSIWAKGPSGNAQPPKAVSQSGVIEINGCVIQPKDLVLTATPMQLVTDTGALVGDIAGQDSSDIDPGNGVLQVRKAHISATHDPHVLNFVIHALKVTRLYTLNVQIESGACGRMTWIGPARGVISPREESSVKVSGFALTTQIDVESTDAGGDTVFRGADALNATTDAGLTRRFRWHTDMPGVTEVELQIAADQFPSATETPSSCGSPPGLLTKVVLHGTAGNNFSPLVDFSMVLPTGDENHGEVEFTEEISEATRYAFANGAPLYVRAIPLRAGGTRLCDLRANGAAGMARLIKSSFINTLMQSPSVFFDGEYHPAQNVWPYDHCVTAVKPHRAATQLWNGLTLTNDTLGYSFYVAGKVDSNGYVQPGTSLCWNNSTSVIDDVGNFITGFIDGIASIVNFVANLYNSIKAEIVQLVAHFISLNPFFPCDSTCQGMVDAALTTALASMGIPPSLPDFEALVNDGVDYLKAQVAQQAGLPQVAVDALVDTVISAASEQSGGGGGLPDWVVKDNGFRPARLVLDVSPNPLKLTNLPDRVQILSDGLFSDRDLPLPATMSNGTSFKIPVQLPPNLSNTVDAPCLLFHSADCNSDWPQEFVLKIKLTDWYNSQFAPAPCSQFTFYGDHSSVSTELLGTRAVVPLDPSTLGGTDTFCQ
jgi:hypothetical protein